MGGRNNPLVASAKRTVNSISEAQKAIAHLAGKPLTNKKLGITATLSKNTIGKLGTLKKGEDARLHALAVANVDGLFENAQFDVTHADEKSRNEVRKVHRLGSLMLDPKTGEYVPVMTTVIEYNKDGNRIYSVEAVDVETTKSAGQLVAGKQSSAQQTPIADFNAKITKLLDDAKNDQTRFATQDYRLSHIAPNSNNVPLHDLTKAYGDEQSQTRGEYDRSDLFEAQSPNIISQSTGEQGA